MNFEQARVRALEGHQKILAFTDHFIAEQQQLLRIHEPWSPVAPSLSDEYVSCCREVAQALTLTSGSGVPNEVRLFSLFQLNAQLAPMGHQERLVFYRKAISMMNDDFRGLDGVLDPVASPQRTSQDHKHLRLPLIPTDIHKQTIYCFSPDQQYIRAKALAEMATLYFPRDKESVTDRCMYIDSGITRGIQPWHYQYMADRLLSGGLRNARDLASFGVHEQYMPLQQDELANYIADLPNVDELQDEEIAQLANSYRFGVGITQSIISEAKRAIKTGGYCLLAPVPWCCPVPQEPLSFTDFAKPISQQRALRLDTVCPGLRNACDPIIDYYSRATVIGDCPPNCDEVQLINCHKKLVNQGVMHAAMLHYPDLLSQ